MKQIRLTKRSFPKGLNGISALAFTEKALLRGLVAAGRNPARKPDPVERHDLDGRMGYLRSALDFSGQALKPTQYFENLGSSAKTEKSKLIGEALCAHAAYRELRIPWLVDIETLPKNIIVTRKQNTNQRPDFLGLDSAGEWHVFETKGRGRRPTAVELSGWKRQTRTIRTVNGSKPHRIVSVAFQNGSGEWEILWKDPPASGDNLEFARAIFFEAYYGELASVLLENTARWVETRRGPLVRLPESGISIGLHWDVLNAVRSGGDGEFFQFARRHFDEPEIEGIDPSWLEPGDENLAAYGVPRRPDGTSLFADGVLIRIDSDQPRPRQRNRGIVSPKARPAPAPTSHPSTAMTPKSERETQDRVVALFRDELGYRYLGDWSDRAGNSNVDEKALTAYLAKAGYPDAKISRAIYLLKTEATNPQRGLYDNNSAVYSYLRYGVPVKIEAGKVTETVKLIHWDRPELNDFALAEEVTLTGDNERRPDLVLYVNGIAVGVIELKCSHVSVGDGIRQLLSNQQPMFHAWFFATVQIVFAGNDTEGLRYGTIGTPEKMFLRWKEDEADNSRLKLDKYLLKMCRKERLIEVLHDFVLFDGGIKKLPRVHQYFGIKAAQEHISTYKGGIIWHTQGSGKSIVMVLLAKWILENKAKARVLILTDRDELDKQIEGVFGDAGESIYRTSSGADLMAQLGKAKPRLLCSLVHKFGQKGLKDEKAFDAFIEELKKQPSPAVGELFVFVDECHRTQSGKLHKTMKAILPGAVFIGFTGTPLLQKDKATSLEVFGSYIHTYKFGEAVEDGVVLDLVYEARDIEQELKSPKKVDAWFEAKTKGLNEWQKAALREQWGTMQKVLSSRSRMERVVEDIVFDFGTKPRLITERGNAILVASSIYEAAKYFELLQKTVFKGKCAVVTSYNPQAKDVTLEETGANTETEKQFLFNLYTGLLKGVDPKPGKTKTETYEDEVKEKFIEQPANMRLLVVVDKLLTGFDAPSCTYLYIDKSMQDHGLFQAICRTNRLDGDDKPFGYIVDYKDLFKKVQGAMAVYTSELDHSDGGASPEVLLEDRLKRGKERLDEALEAIAVLCEPVQPPKGELEHIHYFCGNTEIADDLRDHEPQRVALYKTTAALIRAFANIADDLSRAGYSDAEAANLKKRLERTLKLREIIRKASGETIDLKAYEADMRHLIDTYIEAEESKVISDFGEIGLVDLIVKSGIADAIASLPDEVQASQRAVAETIANNVRSVIIKEHLNDPAYYDRMSALLREILADLKAQRIDYEEFLKRIGDLAKRVRVGVEDDTPEPLKKSPALRAIYNNLKPPPTDLGVAESAVDGAASTDGKLSVALSVHETILRVRPADWRGNKSRENVIKGALMPLLQNDEEEVERVFLIVKAQTEY